MFIVDSALQHTCAEITAQGIRGHLSPAERDLLIDGAVLLAVHLDALAQDGHDDMSAAWHEASAAPVGRHVGRPRALGRPR